MVEHAAVFRRPTLLAGLALVASCTHGGSGHPPPPPGSPGPTILLEIEPNDSPYAPDFVGPVHTLTHFVMQGYVEAPGGFDVYDHFEIVANEPVWIDFELRGLHPVADLDLHLWDPDGEEIVASYDSPWDPEFGSFTLDWAGKAVVLLVVAHLVDTDYDLEIRAAPHPFYGPGGPAGSPEPAATGISFPWDTPERYKAPVLDGVRRPDSGTIAPSL